MTKGKFFQNARIIIIVYFPYLKIRTEKCRLYKDSKNI